MARFDDIRIPWHGWEIVREIGKGTFGTVYEIERQLFNTTEKAAMKVISIPRDENELDMMLLASGYDDNAVEQSIRSELQRVEREYALMSKMRGISNIVSCDDFAYLEKEGTKGYTVFIRMELLKSIQNVIKEKRREGITFTEKETIKLGMDISRALAVCEQYNIIHRDIKPQNILISRLGAYNLGDFGTARSLDHSTHATYAGTLSFMAPEVFKRQKYGRTVDIYSLGLVMYWLMNGYRMPFITPGRVPTPEDFAVAENKRMSGEPLSAPCNAGTALSNVILKACAYNSEDRYGSAADMLRDLTKLESGAAAVTNTVKPAEQVFYRFHTKEPEDKPHEVFDSTLPLFGVSDNDSSDNSDSSADSQLDVISHESLHVQEKSDPIESSEDEYERGLEYYNREDYPTAVHWFRQAARKDSAAAQSMLGLCYFYGKGVEQDYQTAAFLFDKAAEQGDVRAMTNLGVCYRNGYGVERNDYKAASLYMKAARKGNSVAQTNIGECYFYGSGVIKNYETAAKWFRRAALKGNPDAQYNLGMCYHYWKGVEQSFTKAEEWYQKAAEQGHQGAITNLKIVRKAIENSQKGSLLDKIKWKQNK